MVTDACAAQRFFFDGIASCGSALMVAAALILDRMTWRAVVIDQKQIDAFGIDASVCVCVAATQNFTERNLGHDLPAGIASDYVAIQFLENPHFTFVEQGLN